MLFACYSLVDIIDMARVGIYKYLYIYQGKLRVSSSLDLHKLHLSFSLVEVSI